MADFVTKLRRARGEIDPHPELVDDVDKLLEEKIRLASRLRRVREQKELQRRRRRYLAEQEAEWSGVRFEDREEALRYVASQEESDDSDTGTEGQLIQAIAALTSKIEWLSSVGSPQGNDITVIETSEPTTTEPAIEAASNDRKEIGCAVCQAEICECDTRRKRGRPRRS